MSGLAVVLGWVFHGLVGLVLVTAGAVKLVKPPKQIAANFTRWNLIKKIRWVGLGELLAGLILVFPPTSNFGVLVASAIWGGAIVIHLAHEEPFLPALGFQLLTWAGLVLKAPAFFGLG